MEGERRIVTMLFCDVKGSTALAERLDPEDWAEIMNGAFEYLIPPVFHYEGMVPRMMGDAILAFFGAPIAHEDDPERAVRAGLEMIEGIREYRRKLQRERGLDFDVRVGINTGLVVVGGVGTDLRLEYTAMGDAINLAARMEQTAQPGTVQISDSTYRLVSSIFEVEPIGVVAVKGKSEPVEAYRVVGVKVITGRLYGIARDDSPFVGREKEMEVLLQNLADVTNGQGRIICLIGDAGLGKTRLIGELKKRWEQGPQSGIPGPWGMVSSASFAAYRPYAQFRQHLIEHMGIREIDPPEVVREKISRAYSNQLSGLRSRAISIYSILLGLERMDGNDNSGYLPIEGQAFKDELFNFVLSYERVWLDGKPGVQVFDDIQWADPASSELFVHMLQLAREEPFLFIFAFRPDPDSPAWTVREAAKKEYSDIYTELLIDPLSTEDSKALIHELLLGVELQTEILDRILEKVDGNPLFIEEVVYDLLDRGDFVHESEGIPQTGNGKLGDLAIPESLYALFLARMDRLQEDTRRTLQLASVIGRSFYFKVLKRIVERHIELDQELHKLQDIDMICEESRQPELEYAFRHALTQEAAYNSILLKRRREYHQRIGESLENIFSEQKEKHAELLAFHFYAAGDSRARKYYMMAGKKAAQIYARNEALEYYSRALVIPDKPSPEETMSIYESRGELYFSLGNFEGASADFEAALQLSRSSKREGDEARMMAWLAMVRWSSGRGKEALELAKEAEAKAIAIGDEDQALFALIILGTALQNTGIITGARFHLRRGLLTSKRQGNHKMTALSLYFLTMLENFAGRFQRSAVYASQAHELFLHFGDKLRACGVLYTWSLAEGGYGKYDRALEILEEGRSMAEEISSLWLARYPNQRAWISAELGDWETAFRIDIDGLHSAQKVPGYREIEISTLINLVLDCIALRRLEEAEEYIKECQTDLGDPKYGSHNWRWSIRLADARARLYLARDDFEEAAVSTAALLDQAKKVEARKYAARGLELAGQIHMAQGDFQQAEADLLEAVKQADRICYLPLRIQGRFLLGMLYKQVDHIPKADVSLAKAIDLIKSLEEQIKHPEIRLSFERGIGKYRRNPPW